VAYCQETSSSMFHFVSHETTLRREVDQRVSLVLTFFSRLERSAFFLTSLVLFFRRREVIVHLDLPGGGRAI